MRAVNAIIPNCEQYGERERETMPEFELGTTRLEKVTRFGAIDAKGRAYLEYDAQSVEPVFQDEDQTLKIFLKSNFK